MAHKGKHALITGGSRGIGRGIALKLAENGVKVAVAYYKNDAANDTLECGLAAPCGAAATKWPRRRDVANSDRVKLMWRIALRLTLCSSACV